MIGEAMTTFEDLMISLQKKEGSAKAAAIQLLSSSAASIEEKVQLAEVLGVVGDSRLSSSKESSYWVQVDLGYIETTMCCICCR